MDSIKVCFVGVGSIASRHICNLRLICEKRQIGLIIDAFRRKESKESSAIVDHGFTDLDEMPSDYDAIFITNPTEHHLESLKMFHNKGKHFFIEKPLVSQHLIEKARAFRRREGSLYYVACPLRYNAVIRYIKNSIDPKDVISVRSISSSYLPDWRHGQDYRQTYSAHKKLGGGVSIDLIHEWDYLTYLFGMPEMIKCFFGKKSALEIDSDDYAIYIAELKDKIIELHLDYFGRETIREIQLFTHDETIIGDLVNNNIKFMKSGKQIQFEEERDDYQRRELNHFLNIILGTEKLKDEFLHAIDVINLSQGRIDINH